MTVRISGSYQPTGPEPATRAQALAADNRLSLQDLRQISRDGGATLSWHDLVAAGFTQVDAYRILREASATFGAENGAVTLPPAPPAGSAAPVDDARGINLQATGVAGFDPRGDGQVNFEDPRGRRRGPAPARGSVQATAESRWGSVSLDERRAHLLALQQRALELSNNHTSGAALWSQLTQMAIDLYAGETLTPQRLSDLVMQDLAIVLLGPEALGRLDQYEWVTPHVLQDSLVDQFQDDFAALLGPGYADLSEEEQMQRWVDIGFAGGGIDPANGADFRPEFRDGSDGQIGHCFFYQFATYVTNAPRTVQLGSVGHEVAFDRGGHTTQDHAAALVAIGVGGFMRAQRDSGDAREWLAQWPTLVAAAYGDPASSGAAASPIGAATDAAVRDILDHRDMSLADTVWAIENGLIVARQYGGYIAGEDQGPASSLPRQTP